LSLTCWKNLKLSWSHCFDPSGHQICQKAVLLYLYFTWFRQIAAQINLVLCTLESIEKQNFKLVWPTVPLVLQSSEPTVQVWLCNSFLKQMNSNLQTNDAFGSVMKPIIISIAMLLCKDCGSKKPKTRISWLSGCSTFSG